MSSADERCRAAAASWLSGCAAFALLSLASAPPPAARTEPVAGAVPATSGPATLVSEGSGQEPASYKVDYERSSIVAILRKGGFLRFIGHEHGIVVSSWSAEVVFDEQNLDASSISVTVEVVSLIIDSQEARRRAEIDPEGPGEGDLEEIRAKMMSDEQLAAREHPLISFRTAAIVRRDDDELVLGGLLTIRGVSRGVNVLVKMTRNEDGLRVAGELEIKHTDFGIEPVSIGGVVKVKDELEVRFEVFASRRGPAGS